MRSKEEDAEFPLEIYIPTIQLNLPLMPKLDIHHALLRVQSTTIQDFSGGDLTNQGRLSVLPSETWLLVFFHLKPKDIVAMMLSCKFFGEITNNREILIQLAQAHRTADLVNKLETSMPPKGLLAELGFLRSVTQIAPLNFPSFPMIKELQFSTAEVFQPGEQGFSMKPS